MNGASRIVCRFAATAAVLVLLGACAKVRYPTSYVLNFPPATPRMTTAHAQLGSIVVRRFRCPEYLCEGRIVYRPGPEEVATYEYHRWAMDPSDSITQFVADSLRSRSLFRHVARPEPRVQSAYILSGSIDRLEEVDEGRDVRVVCTVSMQVTEADTGLTVWSDTASKALNVADRNMTGVVRSLSAAAQSAVDHLVTTMEAELKSSVQPHLSSSAPNPVTTTVR